MFLTDKALRPFYAGDGTDELTMPEFILRATECMRCQCNMHPDLMAQYLPMFLKMGSPAHHFVVNELPLYGSEMRGNASFIIEKLLEQ